jgi:hypothetical protein
MWVAGPGNYCVCFALVIRFVLSDAITRINCSPFRVPIQTVDLNREPLPSSDNRFALVPLHATNWIVYHRDKRTYGTLDERNAGLFE